MRFRLKNLEFIDIFDFMTRIESKPVQFSVFTRGVIPQPTVLKKDTLGLRLALPTSASYQHIRKRQDVTRLGRKKAYFER